MASSELIETRLRAAHALGQLDGRMAALPPLVGRRIGFAVLRHTLVNSLEDAGFSDADRLFDRWLAGGSPPIGSPQVIASPDAIVSEILSELRHHQWEPLADAAALVGRAASHWTQIREPALTALFDQAGQVMNKASRDIDDQKCTFEAVSIVLELASGHAAFAPGIREEQMFETDVGRRMAPTAAPRSALWSVNIMLGQALKTSGFVPIAFPFPRALTPEALRQDLEKEERSLAWARSLLVSVRSVIELTDNARRRHDLAAARLITLRSTSRAPLVHTVLDAFGPMSAAQLTRGVGVTRLGLRDMLKALERCGLVTQEGPVWRAISREGDRPEAAQVAGFANEDVRDAALAVDEALARIDALLAKTAP